MDSLEAKSFSVTAYEQPWTMVNAYRLFVFLVSKVASPLQGCEPYSNIVMFTAVFFPYTKRHMSYRKRYF